MAGLAEQSLKQSAATRWLRRLGFIVTILAVVGLAVWLGITLSHQASEPERQVARITILPETPPPPPPPPPEQKPQPQQEQLRQQVDTPKPLTPPEPQQLKMEGPAGNGPSPFAAGAVQHEYIGGDIGDGPKYSAYIARLSERIQAELTRRRLRLSNVKLFVWLASDGSIQRYTVQGGGDGANQDLRAALSNINRGAEAPLTDMPMPVGLQIN